MTSTANAAAQPATAGDPAIDSLKRDLELARSQWRMASGARLTGLSVAAGLRVIRMQHQLLVLLASAHAPGDHLAHVAPHGGVRIPVGHALGHVIA